MRLFKVASDAMVRAGRWWRKWEARRLISVAFYARTARVLLPVLHSVDRVLCIGTFGSCSVCRAGRGPWFLSSRRLLNIRSPHTCASVVVLVNISLSERHHGIYATAHLTCSLPVFERPVFCTPAARSLTSVHWNPCRLV